MQTSNDLRQAKETARFAGRTHELTLFRDELLAAAPRRQIFYITGQAGAGKSTLLDHYQEIATANGFVCAETNEQQHDIPTMLNHLAQQFSDQGHPLTTFEQRHMLYRQKLAEIEHNPQTPQELAALFGRSSVRSVFAPNNIQFGVRKGLDLLAHDTVSAQAGEWRNYLAEQFPNQDELLLLCDPLATLTPLFFADLNELAQKQRVLLCFENFEGTPQELLDWLLRLRDYRPSLDVCLVFTGRTPPGAAWDPLRHMTQIVTLDVFTSAEAEAFLDARAIKDTKHRHTILKLSNRLPILMSFLAAPASMVTDKELPTDDLVERFLSWITDPALRDIALRAALPRTFDLDILSKLSADMPALSVQDALTWLQNMPFVQHTTNGWCYHPVVRLLILRHQRQHNPRYRHLHATLAAHFDTQRQPYANEQTQWTSTQWQQATRFYLYHNFAANPEAHWGDVVSLLIMALRHLPSCALVFAASLYDNDVDDEATEQQKHVLHFLHQQIQHMLQDTLSYSFAFFEQLCSMPELSTSAKAYAFAQRGELHRLQGHYKQAFSDLNRAIAFDDNDAKIFASRGELLRLQGRYKAALADLDRALTLDDNDARAFASRGEIHRAQGRYELALADFERSLALDSKNAWTIASRGQTYQHMQQYELALADLNHALALNDTYSWAFAARGEVRRVQGRYDLALADLDRALALDDKNAWAFAHRGEVYRVQGYYELALTDLNRSIALDDKNAWTIASRGQTYQHMHLYEPALADLSYALTLNDTYAWAFAHRGEVHRVQGRYDLALADLDRAIALDDRNAWTIASRGEVYRLQERYTLALIDFDYALLLDDTLDWAFASRGELHRVQGRYEQALADFDRTIALNDRYAWAIASRGQTYQHMQQYEQALADFERALTLDDTLDWAFASRGELHRLQGRYELALTDFERALTLDATDAWAFARRGEMYRLQGLYQQALADFERAFALNDADAWTLAHRGEIYRVQGQYELALTDLDRALTLDATDAWAFARRGEVYRLQAQYKLALADFDCALVLDANGDWTWYDQAQVHLLMGNTENMQADIAHALRLAKARFQQSPDNQRNAFNMALYLLFQGEIAEAQQHYERLFPSCTSFVAVHEAMQDLKDFLIVQPEHKTAQAILKLAEGRLADLRQSATNHL